jgi:fructokinase
MAERANSTDPRAANPSATPGSRPSPATCIVVGEALVDIIVADRQPTRRVPGGSPLNVAVGLARLGHPVELITELGQDADGELIGDHLTRNCVTLHPGSVLAGRRTNTATAHIQAAGAARYEFNLDWTLGPRRLPPDAQSLHVGSVAAIMAPGAAAVLDLVKQARERNLLVTLDPNIRPALIRDSDQARSHLRELAAWSDIIKLSDEDLEYLQPGADPAAVASDLLRGSAELVVVTAGAGPARAFSTRGAASVQAQDATVADTVGAGDTFMAALIAMAVEGTHEDLSSARLVQLLEAAHQAAHICVTRAGADPPRRDELPPQWPTC